MDDTDQISEWREKVGRRIEARRESMWEFTFLGYDGSDVQVTVWPISARGTVRFCAYPA